MALKASSAAAIKTSASSGLEFEGSVEPRETVFQFGLSFEEVARSNSFWALLERGSSNSHWAEVSNDQRKEQNPRPNDVPEPRMDQL